MYRCVRYTPVSSFCLPRVARATTAVAALKNATKKIIFFACSKKKGARVRDCAGLCAR